MHLRAVYKSGRWDELMGRILDQEFHLPGFGTLNEAEATKMDYRLDTNHGFKMAA